MAPTIYLVTPQRDPDSLVGKHHRYSAAYMYHSLLEVFAVVGPIHLVGPRLVEVAVVVWGHDAQALFLLSIGALYQLEDNSAGRRAAKHESLRRLAPKQMRNSSISSKM